MADARKRPRKQTGPPPAVPGVYVILLGKSAYIGGSMRVHARVIDHLRDLGHGQHENAALQRTFGAVGTRFSFLVRKMPGATPREVADAERAAIEHYRDLGRRIINVGMPEAHNYTAGQKRAALSGSSPATSSTAGAV